MLEDSDDDEDGFGDFGDDDKKEEKVSDTPATGNTDDKAALGETDEGWGNFDDA